MAESGVSSSQFAGSVLVGIAPTRLLSVNEERKFAILQNDDAANVVYIGLGPNAALNAGVRLNAAGGSLWIGRTTDMPYTGEVFAIAAAPTLVLVTEVGG